MSLKFFSNRGHIKTKEKENNGHKLQVAGNLAVINPDQNIARIINGK
jgi:hypothetical protein